MVYTSFIMIVSQKVRKVTIVGKFICDLIFFNYNVTFYFLYMTCMYLIIST